MRSTECAACCTKRQNLDSLVDNYTSHWGAVTIRGVCDSAEPKSVIAKLETRTFILCLTNEWWPWMNLLISAQLGQRLSSMYIMWARL